MVKMIKKRSKKTGLPPGSLVHIGEILPPKVKISFVEYKDDFFQEKDDAQVSECMTSLVNPEMTWINVCGVNDPSVIATLGSHFKLHTLVLEDILNTGQRSKFEEYNNQIFIVSRMLYITDGNRLHDEQVSIVFGKNYLISFLENDDKIFRPIRERIKQGSSRLRKSGADYLAYCLLDAIVDNYFNVLENLDNRLEDLEGDLVKQPNPQTLKDIQTVKREIIMLRKSVWPMREVLNRFQYIESPLVEASTHLYVRDIYDHTVQTIDIIEGFRDVVSGMIDLYLSNLNIRLNEIVKVLTIVSTIFVPLTFLSSLYGMNFVNMPELQWRYGYFVLLLFMFTIAIGMLFYFRRKKWI